LAIDITYGCLTANPFVSCEREFKIEILASGEITLSYYQPLDLMKELKNPYTSKPLKSKPSQLALST
jgi:hypothetical protein